MIFYRPFKLIVITGSILLPVLTHAMGLGEARVRSTLGAPLQAVIPVLSWENKEADCMSAAVESAEGVFIGKAQLTISKIANETNFVITTKENINEPVIRLKVKISCGATINRDYSLLLDPPLVLPTLATTSSAIASPIRTIPKASGKSGASKNSQRNPKKNFPHSGAALHNAGRTRLSVAEKTEIDSASPTKQVTQDVLKLSADEPEAASSLKMSDTLTFAPPSASSSAPAATSTPTDPQSAQKAQDLKLAQIRFAAILRGEDPDAAVNAQVAAQIKEAKEAQAKAAMLEEESNKLRRQNQHNKTLLDKMQSAGYMTQIVAALCALLILVILVLLIILWRARRTQTQQSPWWQNNDSFDKNLAAVDAAAVGKKKIVPPVPANVHTGNIKPSSAAKEKTKEVAPDKNLAQSANVHAKTQLAQPASDKLIATASNNSDLPAPVRRIANEDSLKVEVLSDVTQEAEFWISLNDPQRAIEILEPHTKGEKGESPVPWLYLFDLYRTTGAQTKYAVLRERFRKRFNAHVAGWDEEPDPADAMTLIEFPHLAKQICDRWNTAEGLPFLENLLVDNREGNREGFGLTAYQEIILLIAIAKENALQAAAGS